MNTDFQRTLPSGANLPGGRVWEEASPPSQSDQEVLTDPSTKFELLYPLGRGSYGSVYKARINESGEIVAVKIIPLTEADEMGNIQKEISMLRDCNHPNVVRYYGSWRAADALWIAMEYCAGGSVSDIMHACDAPLEEAVISYICTETLSGLTYLHALGRVHRDIKCGNILLTENGEVKLADFGVAAQLTSTLSKRNTFIGTPHWMAPEVIQASHYDGKVDIWALGISSIEMAERYPPRWRVNPNRVIFMVVREPPPRLADKERWTLAFQDFIAQCLTKDPRSRPTARYLQQHRFLAKDRGPALRALMPLLSRAKAEYAALAVAERSPAVAATASDDVYVSWRPGRVAGGGELAATVAAGAAPHAALDTVIERRSSAAIVSEPAGTMIVRGDQPSRSRDGGLQSPSSPAGGARGPPRMLSSSGTTVTQSEASIDYLAAVQSAGLTGPDLDASPSQRLRSGRGEETQPSPYRHHNRVEEPTRRGSSAATGLKPEMQRLMERLYNVHSSGEVVPLPFLLATDIAPLALVARPACSISAEAPSPPWIAALEELLAEEKRDDGRRGGEEAAVASPAEQAAMEERMPALDARVRSSPMLANVASALARHKKSINDMHSFGVPARLQEPTKAKSEALKDTLRAVLCL